LGNYQQRNFHVEFDLKNERFGFKQQNCVSWIGSFVLWYNIVWKREIISIDSSLLDV
jgi:hypothetical protein